MKTIGKLSINPEKVIKNEELVNLRGGYGGGGACEDCRCYDDEQNLLGSISNVSSDTDCWDKCLEKYPDDFEGHRC